MKKYIVSEVPSNMISSNKEKVYYCYMEGFPNIPVFGSIGDKATAKKVCKYMNANIGR